MPTLLFICTGNQCRSPMAATLARNLLAGRSGGVDVVSAGLLPGGKPAIDEVLHLMKRRGLDASGHVSRQLGDALAPPPDLIVGMAREHALAVVDLAPDLLSRTFTLNDL